MADEIKTALRGLVDTLKDSDVLSEYVGTGADGLASVYDHYHPAAYLDGTSRGAIMVQWTGAAGEISNDSCPDRTVLPVQAEVDIWWRGDFADVQIHAEDGEESMLDLVEAVLTQMRTALHWDIAGTGTSSSVIKDWWITSISAPTEAELEDDSAYRVTISVTINVMTDKPYVGG